MRLKSIKLENWRNFLNYKIDFDSITILIGKNGQGKTNILESIYLLATTKSSRAKYNHQLINWKKTFSRVCAEVDDSEKNIKSLEMIINNDPDRKFQKKAKINGVEKRMFGLLGVLRVVFFSPETIEMIYGSPSLRRRYLDVTLSVRDPKYARSLINYNQILKSRNKILSNIFEGKAKIDELGFWDSQIIAEGSNIILRRLDLINYYNDLLPKAYLNVSGKPGESFRLKYLNSLVRDSGKTSEKILKENYKNLIDKKRNQEIENGATIVGPHRDEILFVLNDKDITTFGSRGEYRSAILALKLVEIDFLTLNHNDKPILLLDDVFSELDEVRRHQLAKAVLGVQTIITTTDLSHLETNLQKKAKVIKL